VVQEKIVKEKHSAFLEYKQSEYKSLTQ